MTDPDLLHTGGQRINKLVMNRGLNKQPARRGTAFAVQAEDHKDHRIQRPVQVSIIEHDDRVLAAEFEVHPFEGRSALSHDVPPGFGTANKSYRVDTGMFCQGASSDFAHTVDQIQYACRQTGLIRDLGEQHRRQRTPLRGLVHNRTARREGGSDLPCRKHERGIPGCDHPDRTQRFTHRVVQLVRCRQM